MIIDILQLITEFCNLNIAIKICQLDSHTYENIKIYSIKNISHDKILMLTDEILSQSKYHKLKILDMTGNNNRLELDHLANYLEELYCPKYTLNKYKGINQINIRYLTKIRKLNIYNNNLINDINHMINLKELICGSECGVCQNGFSNLMQLEKLDASSNTKIYDVNHLKDSLIELNCGFDCGIDQKGISELKKLKKLITYFNNKITDVNHLKYTLQYLNCDSMPNMNSGINSNGIKNLNLLKLSAIGNNTINK